MKKLALVLATAGLMAGCASAPEKAAITEAPKPAEAAAVATPVPAAPAAELGSLKITDKEIGSGTEAVAGKTVSVNYTGRLLTGKQFDTSIGRGPFKFRLGAGQVISGWDQGVAGMKVGGKRELVIPPHMGYGAAGAGGVIPPNAVLVFDVELLGVE